MAEHNRFLGPHHGLLVLDGYQAKLLGTTSVWKCQLYPHLLLSEHVSKTAPAKDATAHVTVSLLITNDCPRGGLLIRSLVLASNFCMTTGGLA